MTNGTSQRCKLAFIRHRQVPRGKLVRAPPPVGHTDKVPCMRDTLSDFCAEHTISTTSQPNMSLLSSLPTVDTARTNKQINSTGLSAGLSLSGPSGQSLINNDTAFNVAAKPEIYLSKNNAKETKPVHSQHSDMIPEKSTHSGEQSVDAKNADVKAIDIESCN
ncbi:hypothetical protein INT43_004272 [Umbelopsis isabellina]|uniref:Uncharacterized protein n=1 Tax=Mortierella isabellina TaxID=91625 RepID=A0A8H7PHX9_MORIS|nr:hypothetical protein INT43_004272 [Umbelopsis isabellina]